MGLAGIYSEMDVNQEQVLMKTVRKGGETDIPVGGQESLREISLWLKSEHAAFIVAQSTWEKNKVKVGSRSSRWFNQTKPTPSLIIGMCLWRVGLGLNPVDLSPFVLWEKLKRFFTFLTDSYLSRSQVPREEVTEIYFLPHDSAALTTQQVL